MSKNKYLTKEENLIKTYSNLENLNNYYNIKS